MKEGDKLYCKKSFRLDRYHKWITKGKCYVVHFDEFYNQFYIIDDENDDNIEIISQQNKNINKYFLPIKEVRKQKLKKIYENSNM